MRKLPDRYYKPNCYWAHMVTFRCPSGCPYCILDGRGPTTNVSPIKEMTGKEILGFWNGLERSPTQRFSLIGGEPTVHPDFVEIVNGLESYTVTLTTNCGGKFYKPGFAAKIKPKVRLRVNTTFHPHFIKPQVYIDRVKAFQDAGLYVEQKSYVYHPEVEKYRKELDIVKAVFPEFDYSPYLGFYGETFHEPMLPEFCSPDESYHDQKGVTVRCGLTCLDSYRDMCGQPEGRCVECQHPFLTLMVGPNGNVYHCHYKLYYDIDPVCHVESFIPTPDSARYCRHYGKCNWCDVPRVGCVKNEKAKPQVRTKLYDKRERALTEISSLWAKVDNFWRKNDLPEENHLKWFEFAYSLLYSGHRHRGTVLDVGSARSCWPYFLASEGYNVVSLDVEEDEWRRRMGKKFGVSVVTHDIRKPLPDLKDFDLITCLSVVEHIDDDTGAVINLGEAVAPGGVIVISSDFFPQYIEYPDANRTIVKDRPPENLVNSRAYTPEKFMERIVRPLCECGFSVVGPIDWQNVDINDPKQRAVRELYTFGLTTLRKKE